MAADQMREGSLTAVADALRAYRRYLVTCHVDPDPDCLGSMLALTWALKELGKNAAAASPDPIRPEWCFLPGTEEVIAPADIPGRFGEPEALVVVDCDLSRTGAVARYAGAARAVINIDHHVTNPGTGTLNFIDPRAAATGEIIHALLAELGLLPSPEAATCLYAAILTDTGSFRFANTTARVLRIAADLVEAGAEPYDIAARIYEHVSWSYLRLLAAALATVERSPDGRVAWMTISRQMLQETAAQEKDADGFIQYPRMVDGVEVALMFREVDAGRTKVGFRSRGMVDVSGLARHWGGGGHRAAAGCTLDLPLEETRRTVVGHVTARLQGVPAGGRP